MPDQMRGIGRTHGDRDLLLCAGLKQCLIPTRQTHGRFRVVRWDVQIQSPSRRFSAPLMDPKLKPRASTPDRIPGELRRLWSDLNVETADRRLALLYEIAPVKEGPASSHSVVGKIPNWARPES